MNPVVSKMDLKKQKKMEEELQKEQGYIFYILTSG